MRTIKRWDYKTPNLIIWGKNLSRFTLHGTVEIITEQNGDARWYVHIMFKQDIEHVDAVLFEMVGVDSVDLIISPIEAPISPGNPGFKGQVMMGERYSMPTSNEKVRNVTFKGIGDLEEIVS